MGDDEKTPLKLNFDPKVHLDFRGRYHHLGRRTAGMQRT